MDPHVSRVAISIIHRRMPPRAAGGAGAGQSGADADTSIAPPELAHRSPPSSPAAAGARPPRTKSMDPACPRPTMPRPRSRGFGVPWRWSCSTKAASAMIWPRDRRPFLCWLPRGPWRTSLPKARCDARIETTEVFCIARGGKKTRSAVPTRDIRTRDRFVCPSSPTSSASNDDDDDEDIGAGTFARSRRAGCRS